MKSVTKLSIVGAFAFISLAGMAEDDSKYLDAGVTSDWLGYAGTANEASMPEANWWKRFDDPILDSLVEVGLQRNYNVAMAARRLQVAKNAVGTARANYFPNLSLGLGYDKERTSGLLYGSTGSASNTSYFTGSVNMSWEIDVFGKISEQVKSAKASVKVSRADRAGVLVSVAAQIATTYFDLRANQTEIELANRHAERQMKALKIAEARFESGLASMLDVDQARTVYYNTLSMLPSLENSVRQDINSLAVLLNESPSSLSETLTPQVELPNYLQPVENGIPADLVRRRPDVVEAEQQINVYAAELGIAKKDYLPDLSLTGSIGVSSHRLGDLFKGASFEYSIAPTLSWTIFDGLARKYSVATARENMRNAVDNYNLAVMTAFEETDNAVSSYFSNLKYIDILTKLVDASRDYDELSIDQYKNGLAPYINVADAQVSYLGYQTTLVEAKVQALLDLVNLYKALGGGWDMTETD